MARNKSGDASTAASPRSSEVKLVQRHTGFQELDVEATQEADAGTSAAFHGTNPFRKGTAAWAGHETIKRQLAGKVPTNSINE